jgi:hypothetical protein
VRRVSHDGRRAAQADHYRAVDLVGGFRATRRGDSRRRRGRSGLDPYRRDGRSLRAEYHSRAGDCGLNPAIEVDGGQNCESAGLAIEADANAIVAGSAIFGSPDYAVAITAIRKTHRQSAREVRS